MQKIEENNIKISNIHILSLFSFIRYQKICEFSRFTNASHYIHIICCKPSAKEKITYKSYQAQGRIKNKL